MPTLRHEIDALTIKEVPTWLGLMDHNLSCMATQRQLAGVPADLP